MAAQRSKALDPTRLFHASTLPLCLLDDEARIAYVNPALESFVQLPADELLGERCQFHVPADASRAQLVAAALAPPADVAAGAPVTRAAAFPSAPGEPERRVMTFVPLAAAPADTASLLVVVGAAASEEATVPGRRTAPEDLHAQLQSFRARHVGRYRLDLAAGTSAAARRLRAQLEVATACGAHVLVTGAAGSGRRSVARAIHLGRDREHRSPLPVLDAATATADVLNAALAGLPRSPANDTATARGTLLVTDVEQLSTELQTELARSLRSAGASWRVLATSARPLLETARAGDFHLELAHLLSTIEIPLVPLAERREDIPLLAQALLEATNGRSARQHTGLSPEALDLLAAYAWPGGVAELAELVERAHRQGEGPVITSRDLDDRVRLGHVARRRETESIVLDRFMTEIEKEVISRALRLAKGNKARAARLLGLTRPRLYRRMEQLGLEDTAPPT